jgi:hypothetical protein
MTIHSNTPSLFAGKARLQTEKVEAESIQRSARLLNAAELGTGAHDAGASGTSCSIAPPPRFEGHSSLVWDVLGASLVSYGAWWHIAFLTLGVFAFWPEPLEWR